MIIKKIVDTFYKLSKEHKLVRSFIYDRISKKKGTGEQLYPQVFLEDPIYINKSQPLQRQIPIQVNFDITCLPHASRAFRNWALLAESTISKWGLIFGLGRWF